MGEGPPIWGGIADYLSGVPLGVLITLFGGGDIMLYLCYGALQFGYGESIRQVGVYSVPIGGDGYTTKIRIKKFPHNLCIKKDCCIFVLVLCSVFPPWGQSIRTKIRNIVGTTKKKISYYSPLKWLSITSMLISTKVLLTSG